MPPLVAADAEKITREKVHYRIAAADFGVTTHRPPDHWTLCGERLK